MSEPLIREATVADRRAIHDVTLAAYEEYAAGMPPALWRGDRSNIVGTLAGARFRPGPQHRHPGIRARPRARRAARRGPLTARVKIVIPGGTGQVGPRSTPTASMPRTTRPPA